MVYNFTVKEVRKMKRMTVFLLSVIMLVPVCIFGVSARDAGTTYYIDSDGGLDSNSGTAENDAWKTLEKASAAAYSAGDRILFKAGGVYTGSFTAKGGGTAENPVTVGAYGNTETAGKPLVYTQKDETLIILHNVSGWVIENLELSAPEGKGIYITANGCVMNGITVRDCSLHNIWYHATPTYNGGYCAVYMAANGTGTRIENLKLSGLDIYDCAYAIQMGGNTVEWQPENFVSPEVSYSQNFIFEDLALSNILYDGMAICSVNNLTIRNCSLLNTSLNKDFCTAPLWMHHANRVTVENCEIAGATNDKDGMALDFDGWTTNSTYQYIYSHDNIRFMQHCVYDSTTKNANCTVRYCLSVNDNVRDNDIQLLNSGSYTDDDNPTYMDNFKFYNNTIVNGSTFRFPNIRNSAVQNNIFADSMTQQIVLTRNINKFDGSGKMKVSFSGAMSNNCFFETAVPFKAKDSVVMNPLFTGSDMRDKNSFKLSSGSPLIGKGVQVEDDMGAADFYGNKLTDIHNIGCYEGKGIDDGKSPGFFDRIYGCFLGFIGRIFSVYTLIVFS